MIPKRRGGVSARDKGKRGEQELAGFLRALGWEAMRGEGGVHRDLVTNIPRVRHPECKFQEGSGRIYEWLEQAIEDADYNQIPVVMHRRIRQRWVAIMRLEDLLELIKKS